jgi:hypothetical protein
MKRRSAENFWLIPRAFLILRPVLIWCCWMKEEDLLLLLPCRSSYLAGSVSFELLFECGSLSVRTLLVDNICLLRRSLFFSSDAIYGVIMHVIKSKIHVWIHGTIMVLISSWVEGVKVMVVCFGVPDVKFRFLIFVIWIYFRLDVSVFNVGSRYSICQFHFWPLSWILV